MAQFSDEDYTEIGKIALKHLAVCIVDKDNKFIYISHKWLSLFEGRTQADFIGKTFSEITKSSDVELDEKNARLVLEGKINNYQIEKTYEFSDGKELHVVLTVGRVPQNLKDDFRMFFAYIIPLDADISMSVEEQIKEIEQRYKEKKPLFIKILDFAARYWMFLASAGAVLAGVLNEFFGMGFF